MVKSTISLVDYDFGFYGLTFNHLPIQARNEKAIDNIRWILSGEKTYSIIDLRQNTKNRIHNTVKITVDNNGSVNAAMLKTDIKVLGRSLGSTSDMNMPVIIPTNKKIKVKKGDQIRLEISYLMGKGFRNLLLNVSPD